MHREPPNTALQTDRLSATAELYVRIPTNYYPKTQLNDAIIASYVGHNSRANEMRLGQFYRLSQTKTAAPVWTANAVLFPSLLKSDIQFLFGKEDYYSRLGYLSLRTVD